MNHLEIAGDLDAANGGEGGEVPVGAEGGFREDGILENLVGDQHIRQLPLDLLGHHLDPTLVRHAPDPPASSSPDLRHELRARLGP